MPFFVFCEGVEHRVRFQLNYFNYVKMAVSSIGETEKSQGIKSGEEGGWEKIK
jgi:hypothetical protein